MSPPVMYACVELISDSFIQAFVWLPAMACVAKLIPANIEQSLFAFFTGFNMLNFYFIGRLLGNFINSITTKTTKEDLSGLWILHAIQACCSLLPLLIIWLLPSPNQVKDVQMKIAKDEEKLKKDINESIQHKEHVKNVANTLT